MANNEREELIKRLFIIGKTIKFVKNVDRLLENDKDRHEMLKFLDENPNVEAHTVLYHTIEIIAYRLPNYKK